MSGIFYCSSVYIRLTARNVLFFVIDSIDGPSSCALFLTLNNYDPHVPKTVPT